MAINLYGQLPNEGEVLLGTYDKAGEVKAAKDEYTEVFKEEGIKMRVEVAKVNEPKR